MSTITGLFRTIHLGLRKQLLGPRKPQLGPRKQQPVLRRNQEIAAPPETAPEPGPISDLSVLLNAVVRRACTLLNLTSGALYLVRPEEDMLEAVAGYRIPPNWIGKKIRLGDGLAGRVAQTRKPLTAQDYLAETGRQSCLQCTQTQRTAGIPVLVQNEVVGVLVLIDLEVGTFSNEEIRLMCLFAGQAAAAIENSRLHAQMQQMVVTDPLTGLFNRLYFDAELARLELGGFFPVSIIVADLNRPRTTGTRSAHAAGNEQYNEQYQDMAQILQQTFRAGDIIARVSGEEFAVLLPHTGSLMAKQMLVRVQIKLAEYNAAHPDLPIQVSLGTSTAQQGELTQALITADHRLYSHRAAHKSPYLEKVTLAIPHSATSPA